MANCVEVTTEGFLHLSSSPLAECSSMVMLTIEDYRETQVELSPSDISSLFFFSFGLVLLSYKSAWMVGVIKNIIGKI